MKKLFLLFFLTVLTLQNFAVAQSIRSAYVFSEEDDDGNIKCQFSNASAVAATKSALRYNRVDILQQNTINSIAFYINVNNIETSNQSCTFALELQVYVWSKVLVPGVTKPLNLKSLICEQGLAGSYIKLNMQDRINQRLKSWVDLCIAEFDKKTQ